MLFILGCLKTEFRNLLVSVFKLQTTLLNGIVVCCIHLTLLLSFRIKGIGWTF